MWTEYREENTLRAQQRSLGGKLKMRVHLNACPTCKSSGFEISKLGPHRCTFCDGTEGGNPPTKDDIEEETIRLQSNTNRKRS